MCVCMHAYVGVSHRFLQNYYSYRFFISCRALAREGDYEMHPVRACVRKCVSQIYPKLLQLQIFCKLIVLMNFHALENFFGFVDLGLKISE